MSFLDRFKREPEVLTVDPTQRVTKAYKGRNVHAPGNQPSVRSCPSCSATTGEPCDGLRRGYYHIRRHR